MRKQPGGERCEQVLWAASGSEAIQKALWAAMDRRPGQADDSRHARGFHGKKGLAGAVTGSETGRRARPAGANSSAFPREECVDVARRKQPFDLAPYEAELERAVDRTRQQDLCADHRALPRRRRLVPSAAGIHAAAGNASAASTTLLFIFDEVQANFGRTGSAVRLHAIRRRARHRRVLARDWATASRSAPPWAGRMCSPTCSTAKRPTPGAPTPSPAPPCWPRSTNTRRPTCWTGRELSAVLEAGCVRLKVPAVAARPRRRRRVGDRMRRRSANQQSSREGLRRGLLPRRRPRPGDPPARPPGRQSHPRQPAAGDAGCGSPRVFGRDVRNHPRISPEIGRLSGSQKGVGSRFRPTPFTFEKRVVPERLPTP